MIRIIERRKQLNMTQEQLADKLGVTQGAVSQWETGLSKPNVVMLVNLSKVLNCTVDELLTGTPANKGA